MKILITGATGNIGSQLVKRLVNKNIELTAMLHQSEKSKGDELRNQNIQVVYGDYNDKESLNNALAGIDKTFMLIPSLPNMEALASNFIEAAKAQEIKHIVKQSVLGADVQAPLDIPKFHARSDEELKKSGIAYTIIQPSGFMQNFIGSAATIKSINAFYLNYGEGKFSTVDVRDIAASVAEALLGKEHENKVYSITGSEAVSSRQVANAIGNAIGRDIKYYPVGDADAKKAMLDMGMNEWFVDNLVGFGKVYANNWGTYVSTDVEKLTGNKPITIQQFANDYTEYFK